MDQSAGPHIDSSDALKVASTCKVISVNHASSDQANDCTGLAKPLSAQGNSCPKIPPLRPHASYMLHRPASRLVARPYRTSCESLASTDRVKTSSAGGKTSKRKVRMRDLLGRLQYAMQASSCEVCEVCPARFCCSCCTTATVFPLILQRRRFIT